MDRWLKKFSSGSGKCEKEKDMQKNIASVTTTPTPCSSSSISAKITQAPAETSHRQLQLINRITGNLDTSIILSIKV